MSDYDKLVEALGYVKDYENADLARQLIEEHEQAMDALRTAREALGGKDEPFIDMAITRLREENERLVREGAREAAEFRARLSAAEKDAEQSEERAELHYRWYSESEVKLQRAEAVVEAAKQMDAGVSVGLAEALRRYEEGKK